MGVLFVDGSLHVTLSFERDPFGIAVRGFLPLMVAVSHDRTSVPGAAVVL